MSKKLTVACLQNCASINVEDNIAVATRLARQAVIDGARFIATPEYFSGLETKNGMFLPAAFCEKDHPVLPAFRQLAQELDSWILLGSIGIINTDGKISNRSYLIDNIGNIVTSYNKIHMFDVNLEQGTYRESETISPGNKAVVAETPWGGLGLSICYDLRFAHLYRYLAQKGAHILAVPAAFTKVTGEAHWHILQRARAIENACFVLAPCQYGKISGGGECYGHSLIVDPWGRVLSDAGEGEGYAIAELDMDQVAIARKQIPVLDNNQSF